MLVCDVVYQRSFRANWTWREVVEVLVIAPAVPETPVGVKTMRLGVLKLARLRRLKSSPRNSAVMRSWIFVSLNVEKSQVAKPGPVSVSRPRLPQNPLLAGGARNAAGLNHCAGLPSDDRSVEIGIHKWADRVAGVSIVGGVVAELWSDGKAGLNGNDAVHRPSADSGMREAVQIVSEGFAASEGQRINGTDDADVADIVGCWSPVGKQVIGVGCKTGRVSRGGLIEGVSIVEGF